MIAAPCRKVSLALIAAAKVARIAFAPVDPADRLAGTLSLRFG